MYSTKLTSKNQTTIPEQVRKFLGIKSGEKVEWVIEGNKVILRAKKRYENPLEIIRTLQIDTEKDVTTLRKEAETELTRDYATMVNMGDFVIISEDTDFDKVGFLKRRSLCEVVPED